MEYINFEHNETAAELVRAAYDTPPLAFVHSYGCQQNVNDGERIKGVLVDIGYGLCDKPEDADLILFNTCAVREHAEQRVFGNVGALKGLKEKKPGLIIGTSMGRPVSGFPPALQEAFPQASVRREPRSVLFAPSSLLPPLTGGRA